MTDNLTQFARKPTTDCNCDKQTCNVCFDRFIIDLKKGLKELVEPSGAYSPYPLVHARNTISASIDNAKVLLQKVESFNKEKGRQLRDISVHDAFGMWCAVMPDDLTPFAGKATRHDSKDLDGGRLILSQSGYRLVIDIERNHVDCFNDQQPIFLGCKNVNDYLRSIGITTVVTTVPF